jgi:hypothetical protein
MVHLPVTRHRKHHALVRIYVQQDPEDPLVNVVTDEPDENAIPVIPTQKAHALWLYASPHQGGDRSVMPDPPRSSTATESHSGPEH